MCGIAGIVGLDDTEMAWKAIRSMTDRLAHRGPDAEGFLVENWIALGHRRLSIIDLSERANQPQFGSVGRYSIILNGEIYNFQEVKNSLPEYDFKTESDTEVILAAYAKYGHDCLKYLNGMFAFAIWDKVDRSLFIARDRLGVKPLYYSIDQNGVVIFASEIRSILASGLVERKLNDNALGEYLMYQSVYSPRTIVEGIHQLPAGEYAVVSKGRFEKCAYWRIDQNGQTELYSDKIRVKKDLRELLLKSVERRMVSDVRLGAFLSGGIDSSAVVGLMSEISDQPIETFSVSFSEKEYDESRYAEIVAQRFGTRHTSVELSPKDFLAELPNALRATDAPSGDGINTYVISKATKNAGIKVALSGLGGDELFAGYPNFLKWKKLVEGVFANVPQRVRAVPGYFFERSSKSKYQRYADLLNIATVDISTVYPLTRQVLSQHTASALLRDGRVASYFTDELHSRLDDLSDFPRLSQFSIAEMLGYTQNVLLKDIDQFSMASALEVREPFFDFELIEYVLRISDEIKYPTFPKSLLVEALAPMLPDEIVHRKKMGFVLPWEQWMRGDLRPFCDERIRALAERNILNTDSLMQHWKDFINGANGILWSHVWHLVVVSHWLDENKF